MLKCLIQREIVKFLPDMSVFGDSGGSAPVTIQFHIVHTSKSHHTKGEPWNYEGCCSNIPKTTASALLLNFFKKKKTYINFFTQIAHTFTISFN